MEVHPPEHGIHTWRDFLVHMGTITLGLLIALGLEGLVEWKHHRDEVAEARERIREELESNRATVAKDREYMRHAITRMRANLAVLDAPGQPDTKQLSFGWVWNDPANSAWDTARATGAVSLMPYEEVKRYSEAYSQQEGVKTAAMDYVKMQVHLVEPLMRGGDLSNGTVPDVKLTATERDAMAAGCAESMTQIGLLLDLTNGLDGMYNAAEGKK